MPYWDGLLGWLPALGAAFAFGFLVVGTGALLKRRWAQRELEALRKKYQETDITDPGYNAARALYFASVADGQSLSAGDHLPAGDGGGFDGGGGGGGD
jgi:hypothetical protein